MLIHSINQETFMKQEGVLVETLHSFKPKASSFMNRYQMAVKSLPEQIAPVYVQLSLAYEMVTATVILFSPIGMVTKAILCGANLLVPYLVLEFKLLQIEYGIDGEILTFLQYVNASLQQSEDLIKALKYAERMTKNTYLRNLLRLFNKSIQAGLDERLAFQQFYRLSGHDYMRYVVLNFEQVYFRRGNLLKLVSGLEQEYTAIQVEINKRKIELKQDRAIAMISLGIVVLTARKVMTDNDYILSFYLTSGAGKTLVAMMVLIFILGIIIVIRATQIKY